MVRFTNLLMDPVASPGPHDQNVKSSFTRKIRVAAVVALLIVQRELKVARTLVTPGFSA